MRAQDTKQWIQCPMFCYLSTNRQNQNDTRRWMPDVVLCTQ
jgi:hypothetical protein